MKRTVMVLAALAVLVAGATALTPAAAAEDLPFKARVAGNAHLSPTDDPNVVRNEETGEGQATHLGAFDWSTVEYANFAVVPGGVAVVGSFTLTAADGDELHGVHATIGLFDVNGDLILHGHFTLVGGTGRFADASGSGALDAVASLGPGLPFEGTLVGTIDY